MSNVIRPVANAPIMLCASRRSSALCGETLNTISVPGSLYSVSPPEYHAKSRSRVPYHDPAWTPLFSQARGLVTDVGGVLAHGSIVAREFGIPAVLGTAEASRRIRHGQRITVDGDQGLVLLEPGNTSQTR